jgi:chromosome segregation ATPase
MRNEEIDSKLSDLETKLDEIKEELESRFSDIDNKLESIDSAIESVDNYASSTDNIVGDINNTTDDIKDAIDVLSTNVYNLRATVDTLIKLLGPIIPKQEKWKPEKDESVEVSKVLIEKMNLETKRKEEAQLLTSNIIMKKKKGKK